MEPLGGFDGRTQSASAYHRARHWLRRGEMVLLTVAALIILAMSLYVAAGIVLRTFFGGKLYDEYAIIGELMVASISLSFAYVASTRGFVEVEIFTANAGRKVQLLLNVLGSLVGLLALIPITIAAYNSGAKSWVEGSYHPGVLHLPEWPGYFVYLVGMAVFVLRLLDLIIHDLLCAFGVIEDDSPRIWT